MNHEELYERLREVARQGELIYYGVIAPLVGLDMREEWDRAEIGRILGAISTHEHEEGRPLLSAVVVHQVDGKPGKGFFALAAHLGVMAPDQDKEAFWQEEVRRVHDYWRNH